MASMHEKLGNLPPKAMCWVCLEMREPLGEVHAFAVGRRGDAMCIGIGHLVLRWEQKEGKNGAWTHLAHRSTRKVECGGWRRRHGGDVGASMDARLSEWDGSSDVAVGDAGKSQSCDPCRRPHARAGVVSSPGALQIQRPVPGFSGWLSHAAPAAHRTARLPVGTPCSGQCPFHCCPSDLTRGFAAGISRTAWGPAYPKCRKACAGGSRRGAVDLGTAGRRRRGGQRPCH